MGNSNDHYVQAAYMGLWSVNGHHNRKGKVHWMDKDSPTADWKGPTAIGKLLAEKGHDELSRDETRALSKLLGVAVTSDSWEADVVQRVEQAGYPRLTELANSGTDGQFSPEPELFSWILLQMVRTPAGRKLFNQSAESQLKLAGHPLLRELLSGNGAAVLYLAFN